MAFDDPLPPIPPEVLAVRDHPRFSEALRLLAANMLAQSDSDRGLAAMFKDAGRYISALCAAALRDEGVTLPRLKALCARFGLLSPGRAHAMLIYLRWLGYVHFWSDRPGRSAAHYSLTAEFDRAWRVHLEGVIGASARLDPAAAAMLGRLDDDAARDAFNRVHLDQLVEATALMPHVETAMRVFINRDAGSQVLWTLLTLSDEDDCPPAGVLRPGVERLATRFGVSATHLKRMLRDARAGGLIEDTGRGEIRLSDRGRDELRTIYAAAFARTIAACRAVVGEMAPSPADAGDAKPR
jgi:AraC-like DNA-binding protein